MRFGILILGVILNIACDPGTTSKVTSTSTSSSTPLKDAQDLKAETDALTEKLGHFDKKLAMQKKSIEDAQADYDNAGDADLKKKSELLLEVRIAEALISDEMKELNEAKIKTLEAQIRAALKQNPDDEELKEADRKAKKLRVKFDQTKEELAKIKAIRQDLQIKEEAIVDSSFGAVPALSAIKAGNVKVTNTQAKLDQAVQTLSTLATPDTLKKAITDMEGAATESAIRNFEQSAAAVITTLTKPDAVKKAVDDLKAANSEPDIRQAAAKAGLDVQVIDAALKNEKNDPVELLDSLRKVTDSIKAERVKNLKDIADKKAKSSEVVNAKAIEDKVDDITAFLKSHLLTITDPNIRTNLITRSNGIFDFKPSVGFFNRKWDDGQRNLFLSKIANFTSLLVKNSYPDLAMAINDFSANEPSEETMMKVKTETGKLSKKILLGFDDLRDAKFNLQANIGPLDAYKQSLSAAKDAERLLGEEINDKIGAGPFDTPKKVKDAAERVIPTLGRNFEARINSIFAEGLDAQKALLVTAAENIKDDLEKRLVAAKKLNADALAEYANALVELAKANAKGMASKGAIMIAQKNMLKFLMEANINRLVSYLKEPDKYGEHAKLINLIAHDLSTRVTNRAELKNAFIITEEPLMALVQALKDQKAVLQFKDPAKLFPKAVNYMIEALKKLLEKGELAKDPMADLIILQSSLGKLK